MPLKLRCPHCASVHTLADELAGERMPCPDCQKPFTVPVPAAAMEAETRPVDVTVSCAHCRNPLAPGTSVCRRCFRDQATGRKLPLSRRLRYVSVATWTWTLVVAGGVPTTAWVGYRFWADRRPKPVAPASVEVVGVASRPASQPARATVEKLLNTNPLAGRLELVAELSRLGRTAAADLCAALEASLRTPATDREPDQRRRGRIDVVRLIGQFGDESAWPVLVAAESRPELRSAAVRARAALGDPSAAEACAADWQEALRSALFVADVARVLQAREGEGAFAAARRARQSVAQAREGMIRLGRPAFELAASQYWDSWCWLGQERAERYGDELYQLAKPGERARGSVGEAIDEVRSARRLLEAVAADGPPAVRAVAANLLADFSPQYKSLRAQMMGDLARLVSEAPPREQQFIAWTVSKLAERPFGDLSERSHPSSATHGDVLALLRWARSDGIANPPPLRTQESSYPRPPVLTRRVVTVRRQAERDLLRQPPDSWEAARAWIDTWRRRKIGATAGLRELARASQRQPNYPAVLAAFTLAADYRDEGIRPQLDAWVEAADQPAWVRSAAAAVRAVLAHKAGGLAPGWLDGLSGGDFDRGAAPPLDDLARVIAAGGATMITSLADEKPSRWTAEAHGRLLAAAREALARTERAGY